MSQRMSQKESKTFLYKKVYQDLKDRIQNGEYLRDALLPSEREIGETYQVDRTTVRKALQLLVDDGLVEKRAGKGTVVVWRPDQEQTQSRPVLRPERSVRFGKLQSEYCLPSSVSIRHTSLSCTPSLLASFCTPGPKLALTM